MMAVQKVGDGSQYRAYCEDCGIGLNWWADDQGKDAADCYAENHNAKCSQYSSVL